MAEASGRKQAEPTRYVMSPDFREYYANGMRVSVDARGVVAITFHADEPDVEKKEDERIRTTKCRVVMPLEFVENAFPKMAEHVRAIREGMEKAKSEGKPAHVRADTMFG